jgi:hypothetical protein
VDVMSKKKVIIFIVVIFAVIALIVSGIFFIPEVKKFSFFENQENNINIITQSELQDLIETSDLYTVSYVYNAVATVYDEDSKNKDTIKYYVSYKGNVDAGIDFSKIDINVDEDLKKITITIPEINIMDITVDGGSLDFIFTDSKYNTEDVYHEAYQKARDDLKSRASEETTLLDTAKENAVSSVEALLNPWIKSVDDEYDVEIK